MYVKFVENVGVASIKSTARANERATQSVTKPVHYWTGLQ